MLAAFMVLLLAACGSEEVAAPAAEPPALSALCPGILARLEGMDARIQKLSGGAQVEDPSEAFYQRQASPEQLEKIEKARHDYLRVRRKAAALGCIVDTG